MGCSCCKDADVRSDPPPNRQQQQPAARGRGAADVAGGRRPPVAAYEPPPRPPPPRTINRCDICGATVDPALVDSHRESCRANHKRRMRTTQEEAAATRQAMTPQSSASRPPAASGPPPLHEDPNTELSEAEACVICIEKPKVYAFIPCGHLAVCKVCAPMLDTCPVCRGPREGLLFVEETAKLCLCKHCKHVIGPTFFDAHREVCALRMRQNPQTVTAATNDAIAHERTLCLQCKAKPRERAFLPCGHFLYCNDCAASATVCPQCCCDIKSTMAMFEA